MSTGGSLKVAPCFPCNKVYGLDDNNFLLLSSIVLFIHRFLDYLQVAKLLKVHQLMAKSSHIHSDLLGCKYPDPLGWCYMMIITRCLSDLLLSV